MDSIQEASCLLELILIGPEENARTFPETMAGSVRLSFRREGFLLVVAFTASAVIALGNTGKCWFHAIPWRFHKVVNRFSGK